VRFQWRPGGIGCGHARLIFHGILKPGPVGNVFGGERVVGSKHKGFARQYSRGTRRKRRHHTGARLAVERGAGIFGLNVEGRDVAIVGDGYVEAQPFAGVRQSIAIVCLGIEAAFLDHADGGYVGQGLLVVAGRGDLVLAAREICGESGNVFLLTAVDVGLGQRIARDIDGDCAGGKVAVRVEAGSAGIECWRADDGVGYGKIGERDVASVGDDELVVHAVTGVLDGRAIRRHAAHEIDKGPDLLDARMGVQDRVGGSYYALGAAGGGTSSAIAAFAGLVDQLNPKLLAVF